MKKYTLCLLIALCAVSFLAGCASAPEPDTAKVQENQKSSKKLDEGG
jgi:outer membrane lipoprotein-sorting protein